MTDYIAYGGHFASYFAAAMSLPQHLERYWGLDDLHAALNAAFSELGALREEPVSENCVMLEHLIEDRIEVLGSEMRRRIRGGQDLNSARRLARRYPPELIARVKAAHDLRDMIARDIGLTKPIGAKICSPLRDDDLRPSFTVNADYFFDFGTHEHGDFIAWRMRWHDVLFWQAVESLAIEAGIPLLDEDTVTLHDPHARIGKVIEL